MYGRGAVITEIELPGWYNVTPADLVALQNFSAKATVLALSPAIIAQTTQLRQQHRIKTPDAIIGATALAHHLTLVARNVFRF